MKPLLTLGLLAVSLLVTTPHAAAGTVYGDPAVPVAGKVLDTVIHTQDAEELRYVVLRTLTDRYAERAGIAVTQTEKDAYVEHLQASMKKDREQHAARQAELQRQLASGEPGEAERRSLTAEIEALDQLLASLDALAEENARNPEETRAARDEVAGAFIRQWKINRALYREFGGRIIFQQGGPEPLDAYHRFLEASQARGDFEITNRDLDAAFWRYYRTDEIHSFFAPGSKEEAQAFDAPWRESQ